MATNLNARQSNLPYKDSVQPVLFIGHGSPMNAIQLNQFSKQWRVLGNTLEKPVTIFVSQAHWLIKGTFVTSMEALGTIHDFRGFPMVFSFLTTNLSLSL